MLRRLSVPKQEPGFTLPFGLIALLALVYGIVLLAVTPPDSWVYLLALIVGVVVCGTFQMGVGRVPGPPLMGVAITMLALHPGDPSLVLDLCVWTMGFFISQVIMYRDLWHTLAQTGVNAIAALPAIAVQYALVERSIPLVLCFVAAYCVYYGLLLAGDLLRQRSLARALPAALPVRVHPLRFFSVILIATLTAVLLNWADNVAIPWLENDAEANRPLFLMLMVASVYSLIAQRMRYLRIERRLNAVVEAAVELPREVGDGLAAALQRRARWIVQANEVELRDRAPGFNEIGAPVELTAGDEQYLVASRKVGGSPFAREDERALETLAHMASEAARVQYERNSLERRANTDALTGLPNYGAFQKALAEANEQREYHSGVALLFIDLDNFKQLNDRMGHPAGDALLRVIADRLQVASGGGDFVARVGGDEFVVILTGLDVVGQAQERADEIIAALSEPVDIEGETVRPVVSAGLAFSSHRELDAQTLVADADRTMLRVKRSRRSDREAASSSAISVSPHRSTRTNDIVARAIREQRLSLALQPIVDLHDERIIAFEALVRYTDPEIGPISPPSLVARAKSLGLLNELTTQVVEKALQAAESVAEIEPSITMITVNLEVGQISDSELGAFLRESAEQHPGIQLCVELNERSLRSVTDELSRDAQRLQAAGLSIALDDYGSDDSSVGAIVHFPMNVFKLDKSLVSNLDDLRQREVVRLLQLFGDNLDYTVVVEGVETAEMARVLSELGVRAAQGYYFGRPLPVAMTLHRLRRSGPAALAA